MTITRFSNPREGVGPVENIIETVELSLPHSFPNQSISRFDTPFRKIWQPFAREPHLNHRPDFVFREKTASTIYDHRGLSAAEAEVDVQQRQPGYRIDR